MSLYPSTIARCQHVKVNGTQCGSPALKHRRFCYFHKQWREQRIKINVRARRRARNLDLPVLEDANSIQITLMQVMRLILSGQIDPKTAGLLLYALQTASVNLKNTSFEPKHREECVIDPREVRYTLLGEDVWDPADFEEDEEDAGDEETEEDLDVAEEDQSDEVEASAAPEAEEEQSDEEGGAENEAQTIAESASQKACEDRPTGDHESRPSIEAESSPQACVEHSATSTDEVQARRDQEEACEKDDDEQDQNEQDGKAAKPADPHYNHPIRIAMRRDRKFKAAVAEMYSISPNHPWLDTMNPRTIDDKTLKAICSNMGVSLTRRE
jgi:hypothetical protein